MLEFIIFKIIINSATYKKIIIIFKAEFNELVNELKQLW